MRQISFVFLLLLATIICFSHIVFAQDDLEFVRGLIYHKQTPSAIFYLRTFISKMPNNKDVRHLLGQLLIEIGSFEEATRHLQLAAAISPTSDIFQSIGDIFLKRGRFNQAYDYYKTSLDHLPPISSETLPENPALFIRYHLLQRWLMTWPLDPLKELEEISLGRRCLEYEISRRQASPGYQLSLTPENLGILPRTITNELLKDLFMIYSQEFTRNFEWTFGRYPYINQPINTGSSHLRIGYISSELGLTGPVTNLLAGAFSHHDRSKVEVYVYATHAPSQDGGHWNKYEESADHFRDLTSFSLGKVVEVVREDKLDMLIDLNGLTNNNNVGTLSRRLAPVQIHWMGWPFTTGADFIDYYITDHVLTPPSYRKFFTEKLIYLPSWLYANHKYNYPTIPGTDSDRENSRQDILQKLIRNTNAIDLITNSTVIFANFNQLFKIGRPEFQVWAKVLKEVPNSVLALRTHLGTIKSPSTTLQTAQKHLQTIAEQYGVNKDRIIFLPKNFGEDYLRECAGIDIYLESFDFTGGSTAVDVIWAGIPFVWMTPSNNSTSLSRLASSLFHAVGLDHFASRSEEQYINNAVALARDPIALEERRKKIIKCSRKEGNGLFDGKVWARALEEALRRIQRGIGDSNVVDVSSFAEGFTCE